MKNARSTLLLAAACLGIAALSGLARAHGKGDLTPEAVAAVKRLFPGADIVGVGRESEHGVSYYEVAVRDGDRRVEIEVTADGSVGEVESEVSLSDLPAAARDGISSLTRGAEVAQVERHEIHGVHRGDAFAPLDPPVIAYEVAYRADGAWKEIAVGEDGQLLGEHQEEGDDSEDSADGDSSEDSGGDDDSSEDDESPEPGTEE